MKKKVHINRKELAQYHSSLPRKSKLKPPSSLAMKRVLLLILALGIVTVVVGVKSQRQRSTQSFGNLNNELRELVIGLVGKPFVDPSGLFSVVPPSGWKKTLSSEESPYNVVFTSPNGPELNFLATPVEDDDFKDLLKRVDAIERETGIEMNIELKRFKGMRATRRTARLQGIQVMAIDFSHDGVAHHIQFSADPEVFQAYLPAIMDLLETYETGSAPAS